MKDDITQNSWFIRRSKILTLEINRSSYVQQSQILQYFGQYEVLVTIVFKNYEKAKFTV